MITMTEEDQFNWDNPDTEEDTIRLIKKYLRTPEQKALLDEADLSIEDLLNGRYANGYQGLAESLFADWNQRLGKKEFGF